MTSRQNRRQKTHAGHKSEAKRPTFRETALPELLKAKDLEMLLKIDVKTIYSYVQRGLIPYVKIQRNVRFMKEEVLAWIEMHSFRPRSMNGKN